MFQNIIEVLILSAIQGISEFLPISSSAHLILVSSLYEFKSSSLLIDISLHLGSLFAIVYYFKEELLNINKNKRLISLIIIGSIPLIIFGYILYTTGLIYSLRNIETIAWTTLIFAIVLYISDKSRFDKKISTNLNIQSILFIGVMQILSLIPGVSRAGVTITAARILKFNTSGITVYCADERSQLKNKNKAMTVLRSRLFKQKQAEENEKYAQDRKTQVGSGDRSERIRTYNFPQSR